MTPKSGKAGSRVAPAEPTPAEEAANADPGQAVQGKGGSSSSAGGSSGSGGAQPHKPPREDDQHAKKSWIEIKLIDEDNRPVSGEAYEVTLPDGTMDTGTLDQNGFVRIEGIDPGTCRVTFPNLDGTSWEKA